MQISAINIIIDNSNGIYIPKIFVENFDMEKWGIDTNSWDFENCKDPYNLFYWESWDIIMERAKFIDEYGNKFKLYQDGDLFSYCYDIMTDEEKSNMGFDMSLD